MGYGRFKQKIFFPCVTLCLKYHNPFSLRLPAAGFPEGGTI
jgi:hypothetical protein